MVVMESESFYQIMRVKASIKADSPQNTSKLIAVYKNVTELCGLNWANLKIFSFCWNMWRSINHRGKWLLPILALQCLELSLERTFFQLGLAKCVLTWKLKTQIFLSCGVSTNEKLGTVLRNQKNHVH